MKGYKRGDIVTINFNPKKGHEVGKTRPVVVISADEENAILDTVIVMPLSTKLLDGMEPYRFRVSKRENLKQDSDVLVNHVRAISKKRIGQKIATITQDEYENIINNLCQNFS